MTKEQENTTEEAHILALNAQISEILIRQNILRTVIDERVTDLEGGAI